MDPICVCLSDSHTFLIVTHSYVSQATHAFLGMLPLCYYKYRCQGRTQKTKKCYFPPSKIGFSGLISINVYTLVRPLTDNEDLRNILSHIKITKYFYTPDLSGRIMVWRGRLSVCLSVCPQACRHNTDWTVWARTVKLGTLTTYDMRTNPIDFQGQRSRSHITH